MHIRCGYWIEVVNDLPTRAVLLLDPHPSCDADIVSGPTSLVRSLMDGTEVPCAEYTDGFANRCRRLVIPPGGAAFTKDMIIGDSGEVDVVDRNAPEVFPGNLPSEVFEYMLSSRYSEVDELSAMAWQLFGNYAPGWSRVHATQQPCDGRDRAISNFAFNETTGGNLQKTLEYERSLVKSGVDGT